MNIGITFYFVPDLSVWLIKLLRPEVPKVDDKFPRTVTCIYVRCIF